MPRSIASSCIRGASGFGLVEFLVALVLFATGAVGLVSSQIAGQRASHAALERTLALAIAEDFLARIHANPAAIAHYAVPRLQAGVHDQPETDCRQSPCTPSELALYDLWHMSVLMNAGSGDAVMPRLARLGAAVACVRRSGGEVTIHLSWRAHTADPAHADVRCAQGDAPRREVALSTWVAV